LTPTKINIIANNCQIFGDFRDVVADNFCKPYACGQTKDIFGEFRITTKRTETDEA